jgi:hypothetical protein
VDIYTSNMYILEAAVSYEHRCNNHLRVVIKLGSTRQTSRETSHSFVTGLPTPTSKSLSNRPSLPALLSISSSSPSTFLGVTIPFNHVANVFTSHISAANFPCPSSTSLKNFSYCSRALSWVSLVCGVGYHDGVGEDVGCSWVSDVLLCLAL